MLPPENYISLACFFVYLKIKHSNYQQQMIIKQKINSLIPHQYNKTSANQLKTQLKNSIKKTLFNYIKTKYILKP